MISSSRSPGESKEGKRLKLVLFYPIFNGYSIKKEYWFLPHTFFAILDCYVILRCTTEPFLSWNSQSNMSTMTEKKRKSVCCWCTAMREMEGLRNKEKHSRRFQNFSKISYGVIILKGHGSWSILLNTVSIVANLLWEGITWTHFGEWSIEWDFRNSHRPINWSNGSNQGGKTIKFSLFSFRDCVSWLLNLIVFKV